MVEYTIDDIRGPTVAREMAQLKSFVLEKFNGAIADAEAAAAAAATAAANAVLANTVKKTGEASQSIAGNVGITGTLDAAAIGSGTTPIVCGNLTAYGSVSLDDTVLQGNLSGADSSALINLAGVGSVLVPTPTANGEAATKKYVDDALDNYAPMVRTTGNQKALGYKQGLWIGYRYQSPASQTANKWLRYMAIPTRYVITLTEIIGTVANNGLCYAKAITSGTGNFNRIFSIDNQPGNTDIKVVCMINQNTGKMEFWIKASSPNNINGLDFINMYVDDQAVANAEYFNTEFNDLPATGYSTAVYILGSA